MSYNSIGTFSSHNNKMEVELSSSRPTGCMCNLQLKKKKKIMMELPSLIYICMIPCFKIILFKFSFSQTVSCNYHDLFFSFLLGSQPSGTTKSHKIALAFGSSLGSICLLILGFGFLLWWRQRHNKQIFFDVNG